MKHTHKDYHISERSIEKFVKESFFLRLDLANDKLIMHNKSRKRLATFFVFPDIASLDTAGFFASADNSLLRSFSLSDDFLLRDHALESFKVVISIIFYEINHYKVNNKIY